MKLDLIVDCTVQFLDFLLQQYKCNKISMDFFKSNSHIKIEFLQNNIKYIKSSEKKRKAQEVLRKCQEILPE